jgi:L-cysteate sulfo-lyase
MKDFDLNSVSKINFCTLPTPIIPLKRLSEHLGKNKIFIKRDDLTGIAFGGNKNRKLEYLLADALAKKANVIITEGAVTSNHCLQTAACSCHLGLECVLVLSDSFIGDELNGNFLLDHILDVDIRRVRTSEDRKPVINKIADELREQGKNPYIIPTGGSNEIGILGYINSIKEIAKQSEEMNIRFDYFVHATGSAGTQAGCVAGKKLYYPNLEIIGINIGDSKKEIIEATQQIIDEFEQKYSIKLNVDNSDIIIMDGYFGEGYGIPSKELIETMKLIAKLEGIFLDPVYNGKAMIGLIDLIKKNHFKEKSNILFLHSGGGPAIFSYNKYFNKK